MPHRRQMDRRERERLARHLQRVSGEQVDLAEDEVWIAVQEF